MVSEGGHVKVIDFGFSFSTDTSYCMKGSVFGTPSYISPEALEGKMD
jgi:serine/threonine protein kinase